MGRVEYVYRDEEIVGSHLCSQSTIIHLYVYVYTYVCVCACVCIYMYLYVYNKCIYILNVFFLLVCRNTNFYVDFVSRDLAKITI